ncbi:MAG: ArsR family transcriptional regulator [Candidatus Heimdallarchaeota archaeon]|nr:ArsR family transcriptional regulator [Candidatus Heimdallarchaeota archaeon]
MEEYIDKSANGIQVIEALADPTRRKILLLIQQNAPKGLTASQLADKLRKKIPTILHHLKSLEELGLAEFTMERMESGGREVKHWNITHQKILVKIDMNEIGFLPEDYILTLFNAISALYNKPELKNQNKRINANFGEEIDPDTIIDLLNKRYPNITFRQAEVIQNTLKREKDLLVYIEEWIRNEFKNSRDPITGTSLQLDWWEFGEYFKLGEKLRERIFDKLVRSGDFVLYEYVVDGQHRQRLRFLGDLE